MTGMSSGDREDGAVPHGGVGRTGADGSGDDRRRGGRLRRLSRGREKRAGWTWDRRRGRHPPAPHQHRLRFPCQRKSAKQPSQAQDIPALTDGQVAKMKESISGDPILTVMLQGGYTINDYGPWVAGDRTFIGAIAEIFLTTPTDYQGSLPMVGFEPAEDGSKEYLSGTLNITASGIKSLIILIDLSEEEVVGIEIGESDTLTLSADGE